MSLTVLAADRQAYCYWLACGHPLLEQVLPRALFQMLGDVSLLRELLMICIIGVRIQCTVYLEDNL